MQQSDSVHQAAPGGEVPDGVHSGQALANAPRAEGSARPSHTPGPWVVTPMTSGNYIERQPESVSEYVIEIGKVNRWKDAPEEAEANARLIAAAPELLEALRELLDSVEGMADTFKAPQRKARAAIAKATGEQA